MNKRTLLIAAVMAGILSGAKSWANPLFPFPDRLPSVFTALGEKAIS